ncbi:carbohydrate binding domain-containing protein [Cohnella sp. REN36]|uniref:carbohydrate binding domain-containing protein n=1 Tax=Cohnella sp. REN36 TaxID=2887347 RepID=UPI001D14F2FA|nr:carbohydrate binding domain-containing protein [Cohnella sp. REN36]MCC3371940.1 carbohydrate binding domain-containing protein [Cohnella sp. REN36]
MKRYRFYTKGALIALAAMLAFGPAAGGSAAAASAKAPGPHWADRALDRWKQAGILQGYPDGTMKPERPISRAEFAAVVNRLFGLEARSEASTTDTPSAWAAAEMAKAFAAGYLSPDDGGRAAADRAITRAEAALALNRLFALQAPAKTGEGGWPDLNGLTEETGGAIRALTANGILQGLPDGTFGPNRILTRAELATIADRLIALLVQKKGTAEPGAVNGHAVVSADGATLRGADIAGNLYLAQGIGEGEVSLRQTRVAGTTFVRGGGVHSIELTDASLAEVRIEKDNDLVRLYAHGGTTIGTVRFVRGGTLEADDETSKGISDVRISSGAKEVHLKGNFARVSTEPQASQQVLLIVSGHVSELRVDGSALIRLTDGAVIDKLRVSASATGSSMEGTGRVGTIEDLSSGFVNRLGSGSGSGGGTTPTATPTPSPSSTPAPTLSPTESPTPTPSPTESPTPTPSPTASPTPTPSSSPTPTTDPGESDWKLVWSDEFAGGAIDPSKWTYDTTNGESVGNPGWGNNELEYYTDRPDNAKVEDGKLVITAKKELYGGMPYTSARLKTLGLFSQTYGKFEIRAKAPTGKGLWPAIWMLPEHNEYGTWAASGEIDIMEGWGSRPGTVAGTIHYGERWPGNVYSGASYDLPNQGTIADYHTYALEWEPNEMRWYVDGELYSTKKDWYSKGVGQQPNYAYPAPFDQPFHLLINLAVGGNFDGNPTENTAFPARMEVDYVRVYAKDQYGPATPPSYPKEAYAPGSRLPQGPDRDLVYNGEFRENVEGDAGMGVPDTAYWALYQDPGASGAVTIEDIGGERYAHVAIARAGGNFYSIQPQSIVSLAKGRAYKLTFDAKTDTARNMTVRLTGGESRGFPAYSQSLNAALTSQFRSYEMTFLMKEASDPAARIEFNLGTDAHPAWFGNVKLVEIDGIPFDHDSAKQPQEDGNLVYNGTFDQGEPDRLSYWHLTTEEGASATAFVPINPASERKLNVAITDGGAAAGDVKLLQKGLLLQQNQDYELRFDVRAAAPRTIQVGLFRKDGTPIAVREADLSASAQTITVAFERISADTDPEGQLVFLLGGAADSLQIDNVKLLRTSMSFDPDTVFYPLRNGDFGNGLDAWDVSGNADQAGAAGAGAIRMAADEEGAKLTVDNQGGRPWNALLFQQGIPVKANVPYELRFEARATVDRPMEVVIENAGPRKLDEIVDLTSEKKTFAFEFKTGKDENVDLKFLLGLIRDSDPRLGTHDVFLSNIVLQVKNAPVA